VIFGRLQARKDAWRASATMPAEKRKLLNLVLSNCTWKGGELTAKYRQPFDILALAVASEKQLMGGGGAETAKNEIWLPKRDADTNSKWRILVGWVSLR